MKRMINQKLIDALNEIDFEELASDMNWVDLIAMAIPEIDPDEEMVNFNPDFKLHFNGGIYLSSLVDIYEINSEEPFFPSGKVPNLWTTNDPLNDLTTEFISQLRVGDLIYSSYDEMTAEVNDMSATACYIKYITTEHVGVITYELGEEWAYTETTETPLTMVGLTNSFNQLDATLKTLCETAISSGNPQPCSQAQWDVIKALLDKSLYFIYEGNSMIKILTNGINVYVFGGKDLPGNQGYSISFAYDDTENHELSITYSEV